MGNYTEFELENIFKVKDNNFGPLIDNDERLKIVDEIRSIHTAAEFAIDYDGYCGTAMKWYSFRDDLKEFSLKYPNYIFQFNLDSEDYGKYITYFYNGKLQVCKEKVTISYEKFDFEKLK